MRARASVLWFLAAVVLVGCTHTPTNRFLVRTTLRPPAVRRSFFEATLRVLDAHPEYVDELYRQVTRHPPTLRRFLVNHSAAQRDEAIARMTAEEMVRHPDGLAQVLAQTMLQAQHVPAARRSIARSMAAHSRVATDIIADEPRAVENLTRDLTDEVRNRPAARRGFLTAIRSRSRTMARILGRDSTTLAAVVRALATRHPGALARAVLQSADPQAANPADADDDGEASAQGSSPAEDPRARRPAARGGGPD